MKNKSKIEQEIINLVKKNLEKNLDNFNKQGLTFESPRLIIVDEKEYTSEIQFYILNTDNKIIDAIEFFIFFKGQIKVSQQEIVKWLQLVINDICKTKNSKPDSQFHLRSSRPPHCQK